MNREQEMKSVHVKRSPALLLSAAVSAGSMLMGTCAASATPAANNAPVASTAEAPATGDAYDLVLGVGADESQRNLAWYSASDTPQVVQFAKASSLRHGQFPERATTVKAVGERTTNGDVNRKAEIKGLVPNTEYVYRVGAPGAWSKSYHFTTQSFHGDFNFLFFGDPQIGASGDRVRDEQGWQDTLNVAQASYPKAEMLFSAGDQVEKAANEDEYKSYLAPDQLRQVATVATNGNHDVGSKAYEQHYNTPNLDLNAGAGTATSSGGDYWFFYKDVLFVNINSNSRDYASHNAFLDKVVAEQGSKAKWKVLAFHHSIYSVAAHTNDADIIDRRNNMPAKISELGFDMVLMGHDHSYTRSYLIKDGQVANSKEVAGQQNVKAKAGEVLYVTANSASGSKYYDVLAPNAPFASVINQEHVRNYSAVEVTDGAINVKTLRSQSGPDGQPVNSVVDNVTLTKASKARPPHGDAPKHGHEWGKPGSEHKPGDQGPWGKGKPGHRG